MNEWLGIYEVAPDKKGRVTLPVKFRSSLPNDLLISGLPKGFLIVCDPKLQKEALIEVPESAFEILTLDSQGRLTIPPVLLGCASLDDRQSGWAMWFPNRVEIWEKNRWDEYIEELAVDIRFTRLREEFMPFITASSKPRAFRPGIKAKEGFKLSR